MKPGYLKNAQIVNKVAAQDLFKGGKHIVDEVLRQELPDGEPVRESATPATWPGRMRQAKRQRTPPPWISLRRKIFANFVRKDIWNEVNRSKRSALYHRCTFRAFEKCQNLVYRWFKIIGKPFTQLLTIHAFLNQEGETKQVPLCYVLMSGSKKKDYKNVLKGLLELIPGPRVKMVMVDFEEAFWLAIPAVLGEEVEIQGCTFHWTLAVFRHAKHLGLQSAYQKDEATRIFIEKILALPYLPAEHIPPMWEKLHRQASEFPASPLKTNLLGLKWTTTGST